MHRKWCPIGPGLVDFAIGVVNYVFNLPDWQVNFLEEFKSQKNCNQSFLFIKMFWGLIEMTFGLVHATILNKTTWENVFINAHYLTQQNYFQINGFA